MHISGERIELGRLCGYLHRFGNILESIRPGVESCFTFKKRYSMSCLEDFALWARPPNRTCPMAVLLSAIASRASRLGSSQLSSSRAFSENMDGMLRNGSDGSKRAARFSK